MLAPPTFTTVTLNDLPSPYITGLAPAPTFSLPVANVADACDGITFVPKKAIASLNVKLGDSPVKKLLDYR